MKLILRAHASELQKALGNPGVWPENISVCVMCAHPDYVENTIIQCQEARNRGIDAFPGMVFQPTKTDDWLSAAWWREKAEMLAELLPAMQVGDPRFCFDLEGYVSGSDPLKTGDANDILEAGYTFFEIIRRAGIQPFSHPGVADDAHDAIATCDYAGEMARKVKNEFNGVELDHRPAWMVENTFGQSRRFLYNQKDFFDSLHADFPTKHDWIIPGYLEDAVRGWGERFIKYAAPLIDRGDTAWVYLERYSFNSFPSEEFFKGLDLSTLNDVAHTWAPTSWHFLNLEKRKSLTSNVELDPYRVHEEGMRVRHDLLEYNDDSRWVGMRPKGAAWGHTLEAVISNPVSICVDIRPDDADERLGIMSQYYEDGARRHWSLEYEGGHLFLRYSVDGTLHSMEEISIPANERIVLVFGENTLRLNDAEVQWGGWLSRSHQPLRFGLGGNQTQNPNIWRRFIGDMRIVGVWERELGYTEVQQLMGGDEYPWR